MLGGAGLFRGSSTLVSGAPGTGKSSVGASFVNATCARGERALLFAYEESASQLLRNMGSIGLDLARWVAKGQLHIDASRPTLHGLEQHLVAMHDIVVAFRPEVVAVDPISNLTVERDETEVKPTLMRLIDFLKKEQITAVFTSLTTGGSAITAPEDSQVGVSSLMDVWLLLRNHEHNGERNRTLYVLKARGMSHSNQVREFVLSDTGVDLVEVYVGSGGVLTGAARASQEAGERAAKELREQDCQRRRRKFASRRKAIEAQIAMLQAEAEAETAEMNFAEAQETAQEIAARRSLDALARLRGAATRDKTTKAK